MIHTEAHLFSTLTSFRNALNGLLDSMANQHAAMAAAASEQVAVIAPVEPATAQKAPAADSIAVRATTTNPTTGAWLLGVRLNANLNQAEIGDIIGLGQNSVSRIERDLRDLSPAEVRQIEAGLNVTAPKVLVRIVFAKTIRELRETLGLTRAQFGGNVGVTASAVREWERGHSLPTNRTARDLSIHYERDMRIFKVG